MSNNKIPTISLFKVYSVEVPPQNKAPSERCAFNACVSVYIYPNRERSGKSDLGFSAGYLTEDSGMRGALFLHNLSSSLLLYADALEPYTFPLRSSLLLPPLTSSWFRKEREREERAREGGRGRRGASDLRILTVLRVCKLNEANCCSPLHQSPLPPSCPLISRRSHQASGWSTDGLLRAQHGYLPTYLTYLNMNGTAQDPPSWRKTNASRCLSTNR